MLKIKKGIKKKIKGKKDKGKEDDLFDPEQLEKLKKELEEKRKAAGENCEDSSEGVASSSQQLHEQDEEWLKFQALTAGVDKIVRKTTEDLSKIKETSFYQRKSTDPTNLWKPERSKADLAAEAKKQAREQAIKEELEEAEAFAAKQEEEKEPEFIDPDTLAEPEQLDDDLFDTSYLDAIASGEIQLAYIPDSPTEEEGDDPFDTSGVADVVKQIEEAENKAKRQVNLGSAVDVLSGKGGQSIESRARPRVGESNKKARARPRAVNLLGEFDPESGESSGVSVVGVTSGSQAPKDIFDDLFSCPINDVEPTLDLIIKCDVPKENQKKESPIVEDNFKDILGEFDLISQTVDNSGKTNNTSNYSTVSILASILEPKAPTPEEDEFDQEFAALAAESIHKEPSPLPSLEKEGVSSPQAEEEEEDPFDTTFVEKVAPPGKFELRLIESEVLEKDGQDLNDDDNFDFNPRVGEGLAPGSVCPNPSPRNLLEDHSPSVEHLPALVPQVKSGELISTLEESDPFDTSTVDSTLPGKTELRFLEEELLREVEHYPKPKRPALPIILSAPVSSKPIEVEEDDFDFDPRKDESKPEPEKALDLFDIPSCLEGLEEKVLTPQQEEKEVELDPFDTSIVSFLNLGPGQLELRLLENEFVSSDPLENIQILEFESTLLRELSDPEFDPRGGEEPDPFIVPVNRALKTEDIFDHSEELPSKKPLIPQQELGKQIPVHFLESDFEDPFDTSSIEVSKLLPQSELKQIEGELLAALSAPLRTINPLDLHQVAPTVPVDQPKPELLQPEVISAPQSLFDVDDSFEQEIDHKPLTPAEIPRYQTYSDPFDTSIAENFVPGKVEIKILEQELGVGTGLPIDHLHDPDFNPRGPQPIHPSTLSFVSKTLEPQRSSDLPKDIDPFDTSSADNLVETSIPTGPGKNELKALEAELL